MWVKICGNMSLVDVQASIDAGADAVGFVFAASPRQVTAAQVAAITPGLPDDLTQIGVFPAGDFEQVASWARAAGVNGAQLHGGIDFRLLERLRDAFEPPFFLVQTLHWELNGDRAQVEKRLREEVRALARHRVVDAILIDTKTAAASGGTGTAFDWGHAQEVFADAAGKLRMIVAGGLTPENVAQAIRTLRPWGVDVSSGVEAAPGKKDPARVREFIRAARAAFAEIENSPPVAM